MIRKQKINLFQVLFALVVAFFMAIGIYFINQKNNSYSYKSHAEEALTPTVGPIAGTTPAANSGSAGTPKYNCQALCDKAFKIPENKVKCINPCNKVGDKVAQGTDCRTACDTSIRNGARKQFCYKFCPSIDVGSGTSNPGATTTTAPTP